MHKAAPGPPTPVGSLWAPASALPVERWAAEPTLAAGYPNGGFATNSPGHVSEVSAKTSTWTVQDTSLLTRRVPRDPPSRPSIPEPTPCACSSADAAEAKCRGRGSSRRVAQAPGRPEACREGQAAGGVCPAASRQGWLEGRRRCAVQELPSCWWCMPSCWWVCTSVYSACELCVCSVPGFSEALETFYTVARDVD